MRIIETTMLVVFILTSIGSYAQPVPESGKRWIVVPELTDEFEGTELNTEKWTTDHNVHPVLIWPGRLPAVFHPDKTTVVNGRVLIEVGKLDEPMVVYKYGKYYTYDYYGGCLRAFEPARIGQYYECEQKMNQTEMGGGFWMAAKKICGKVGEIDITESVGRLTELTHSWAKDWDQIFHSNGWYTEPDCSETNQTSGKVILTEKNHERFFRYGFWWKSMTEMLFYLDGEYKYSISLPADSYRELYLQYDIETYDWNPLPEDGGKVANGTLEERTTELNYIHTFKLVNAADPGPQDAETFSIYNEEVTLSGDNMFLTSDYTLSVPLIYKANVDREIHLKLYNPQEVLAGEAVITAYAGYANLEYQFRLDSALTSGPGYTLYADIRPLNSSISDILMSESLSFEMQHKPVEIHTLVYTFLDHTYTSVIKNAEVRINESSQNTGSTGRVQFNVPEGMHQLTLEHPNYLYSDSIEVSQSSIETIRLKKTFSDFYVLVKIDNKAYANVEVVMGDSSKLTDSGGNVTFPLLKVDSTFNYKIIKETNILKQDTVTITENGLLSLNVSLLSAGSEALNLQLKIYPNPVKEVIYVSDTGDDESFKLYNVSGRIIKSGYINNSSISVDDLPNGIYILVTKGNAAMPFIVE